MCRVAPEKAAVHAPRDAVHAPRSLALRLRWIGDQLDKRRRAAEQKSSSGSSTGRNGNGNVNGGGGVSIKEGIHLMCTAIQVTVLILFVRKRHEARRSEHATDGDKMHQRGV